MIDLESQRVTEDRLTAIEKRLTALEERLRIEQLCNRCLQYHGKDPCADVAELEAKLARECVWKPHDNWEEQYWSSSCGEDWAFTEGDPEENRVNFCQGCGGKVVIAPNQQDQDD